MDIPIQNLLYAVPACGALALLYALLTAGWISRQDAGNVRMQVIVANNLVFIAGVERLYVVDLATHQQVWGYPVTGKMSISENGVLYVVPRDGGNLVAVNLH